MASALGGRPLGYRHQEDVRKKISASQIITRLTKHIMGELDKPMEPSQVTAALGLLRKCVPDLTAIEHSGEVEVRYVAEVPAVAESAEAWTAQHQPRPTVQ